MRRLIPPLIGVVIVVVGLIVLLNVFSGRDTGDLSSRSQGGPGTLETAPGNPPSSGPTTGPNLTRETLVDDASLVKALSQGNIAFVYGTTDPPPGLEDLVERQGNPFDPELAAAGQVTFLVKRPGIKGIVALAWKRRLIVASASDPALSAFISAWLGKGEGHTG